MITVTNTNEDQATILVSDFDWALTVDCFYQGWCDQVMPFIEAFCPTVQKMKFSAILKNRDLDSFRRAYK